MPLIRIVDPKSSSQIEVFVRDGLPVDSPAVLHAINQAMKDLDAYNIDRIPRRFFQTPAPEKCDIQPRKPTKPPRKPEGPQATEDQKVAFVANRDAGMTYVAAAKAAGFMRTIERLRQIYAKQCRKRKVQREKLLQAICGCNLRLCQMPRVLLPPTIEGDQTWTPERQYAEDYATAPPR